MAVQTLLLLLQRGVVVQRVQAEVQIVQLLKRDLAVQGDLAEAQIGLAFRRSVAVPGSWTEANARRLSMLQEVLQPLSIRMVAAMLLAGGPVRCSGPQRAVVSVVDGASLAGVQTILVVLDLLVVMYSIHMVGITLMHKASWVLQHVGVPKAASGCLLPPLKCSKRLAKAFMAQTCGI